ncbi:hypothetical protein M9H77_13946 [Catharanthus roseus]|uniref:Uncharacterized protein n=1 Tax=Catharanthus roseus TaxID=4058 RepID=A0ACC0BLL9_CATRO|nr:hypothetical protein M9H77_13946 [Catharanthus roseus]
MMTSMLQEVDDMASVKVQTIIRRCMLSIAGTLGYTSSQHDIQQTFPVQPHVTIPGSTYQTGVLVELRGALVDSLVIEQEVDTLLFLLFLADPDIQTPDTSRWREVRDLSPVGTSLGFSLFRAPSPPGTASSSTPHQLISQASSSDDKEQTDDTDDVQHLGFGHRVGKKTTRFMSSDWP